MSLDFFFVFFIVKLKALGIQIVMRSRSLASLFADPHRRSSC